MRKSVAARPTNFECRAALTELTFHTGAIDATERVDQALKDGPGARFSGGYTPRTMRAFLWMKSGNRERALPLIDAAIEENRLAIEAGDRGYSPAYENAALYLMRGDRAAALEWLERASNAGLIDAASLKLDPLIAPLGNEPRFIQIVDRINREVREMRKRVDLRELDEWIAMGR
jgi:hypothetical protein